MLLRSGNECTFEQSPLRSRRGIAFVCLCLTVLAIVLAAPAPAGAEDEDTSSSVYLVFDPETGEFVTSHDPNQALPNQTGLEDSNVAVPDDPGSGTDERVETSAGFSGAVPVLMIVGAIAVAGGGFVFLRRARRNGS
ncbi:MAG TPA: hypothetical protein VFZ51_03335 [Woeseiaceae bacterium]